MSKYCITSIINLLSDTFPEFDLSFVPNICASINVCEFIRLAKFAMIFGSQTFWDLQ
jgi:hypothetical protein